MGAHHDHKLNINNIETYERCMSHVQLHTIESLPHLDKENQAYDTKDIFIKNVPKAFEKQFAIICNSFPELKKEKISLVFRSISTVSYTHLTLPTKA